MCCTSGRRAAFCGYTPSSCRKSWKRVISLRKRWLAGHDPGSCEREEVEEIDADIEFAIPWTIMCHQA